MSDSPMTRRQFLRTSAWASGLFAATPFWAADLDESMPAQYMAATPVNAWLDWSAPADLANTDPAMLALNRLAFGPRPGDLDRVRGMGLDAFIEEQLSPDTLADARVSEMLQVFPSLTMEPHELAADYALPFMGRKKENDAKKTLMSALQGLLGLVEGTEMNGMPMMSPDMQASDGVRNRLQGVLELIQATVLRQIFSERQLFELMVDFWTNHFNIDAMKNECRFLKTWDDRAVIRKHALGKFRDLLMASARSPAMLVFLDNVSNIKGVAQENYAREVMELHTLGVNGGYTQKDVQEVARAFTGWSVALPERNMNDNQPGAIGTFIFRRRRHDNDAKQILGVTLPAGEGIRDGERVLEMLATHPSTATHIAFKLARRFVDDNPPPALVARAAKTFAATDGDVRAVMSTLLHSAEFKTSFGKKLKRPLEFVVSALRALDAQRVEVDLKNVSLRETEPNNERRTRQDETLARTLRELGQVPFLWASPDGYPDVAGAWVNASNLLTRWNFALALTTNQLFEYQVKLQSNSSAADAAGMVDEWSARILHRALPEPDRAKLIRFLNEDSSATRVQNLAALLVASPHFQYR